MVIELTDVELRKALEERITPGIFSEEQRELIIKNSVDYILSVSKLNTRIEDLHKSIIKV